MKRDRLLILIFTLTVILCLMFGMMIQYKTGWIRE